MNWQNNQDYIDRFFGSLPYLLPVSGAMEFGVHIFPQFKFLVYPLLPFILIDKFLLRFSILPGIGGEFIIFMALFFLVIRSDRLSRFIRLNTMQALLLQIGLFIATLALTLLGFGLNTLPGGLLIEQVITNTIFMGMVFCFFYSLYYTVRGEYPEIPGVSDAASMQIDGRRF
ncbi:hypothetical protein Pse7367_2978 [Thalassoporum mexicanum PCC 7367]|uniref:Tic20 family protein n=1 Tax=Thalassoporum mexicanum TaxID=3457544 RepID=UPI00029FE9B1|nr:Tic20 family protein [Pseudanabaena sp. PCC 7367]AFY71229.1 hypothetical protein Pse7367_2978 [Pseudanabaena sp. PCC 7367]